MGMMAQLRTKLLVPVAFRFLAIVTMCSGVPKWHVPFYIFGFEMERKVYKLTLLVWHCLVLGQTKMQPRGDGACLQNIIKSG